MEINQTTANDNTPASVEMVQEPSAHHSDYFTSLENGNKDKKRPVKGNNSHQNQLFGKKGGSYQLGNGDSIGRHQIAQERAYSQIQTNQDKEKSHIRTQSVTKNRVSFVLAALAWLGSLVGIAVTQRYVGSADLRVFSYVLCGWASLYFAYIAKGQGRALFSDIGYSSLFASVVGGLFAAKTVFNIPLSAPAMVCGLAYICVAFSAILKESYFLTLSVFLALSWTCFWFLQLQTPLLYWSFPFLWAIQMYTALKLKAKIPLALLGLSGLFCLGVNLISFVGVGQISAHMAICTLFAAGLTYSKIGQTLMDSQMTSGLFQTNFGWIVAILSALALQDYWLMQEARFPWAGLSPKNAQSFPGFTRWSLYLLPLIGMIALCIISRLHKGAQSLWSGITWFGFACVLPASIIFKNKFIGFGQSLGLSPSPDFGILIGGAITGLAITALAQGLFERKLSTILISIFALFAQSILIMETLYQHPNNMILFGLAVLGIAATAGLITHQNKQYRQAHLVDQIDLSIPSSVGLHSSQFDAGVRSAMNTFDEART